MWPKQPLHRVEPDIAMIIMANSDLKKFKSKTWLWKKKMKHPDKMSRKIFFHVSTVEKCGMEEANRRYTHR